MERVAIVSGGMDSVTLAYQLTSTFPRDALTLVSFDYGQRHVRELECARDAAQVLDADHIVVDLHALGARLGSALTDSMREVPQGHYAEESMRQTVVPNRNAIMLSIATGIAVARGAQSVWTGVHAGDHAVYPDCRPEFIASMSSTMRVANEGFAVDGFGIVAPFSQMTKADICKLGDSLAVPWDDTWSCYVGASIHCGACGTCFERREAFTLAGVDDPTEYSSTPEFASP